MENAAQVGEELHVVGLIQTVLFLHGGDDFLRDALGVGKRAARHCVHDDEGKQDDHKHGDQHHAQTFQDKFDHKKQVPPPLFWIRRAPEKSFAGPFRRVRRRTPPAAPDKKRRNSEWVTFALSCIILHQNTVVTQFNTLSCSKLPFAQLSTAFAIYFCELIPIFWHKLLFLRFKFVCNKNTHHRQPAEKAACAPNIIVYFCIIICFLLHSSACLSMCFQSAYSSFDFAH